MFDDEYHGKGGSYIVDPETGKRRPASEQESKQISEAVEVEESNAAKEQTIKKPKGGE